MHPYVLLMDYAAPSVFITSIRTYSVLTSGRPYVVRVVMDVTSLRCTVRRRTSLRTPFGCAPNCLEAIRSV